MINLYLIRSLLGIYKSYFLDDKIFYIFILIVFGAVFPPFEYMWLLSITGICWAIFELSYYLENHEIYQFEAIIIGYIIRLSLLLNVLGIISLVHLII